MSGDGVRLELNERPDGYGFIYGELRWGGHSHNVNILPPIAHWVGACKLEGYEPHPSEWVLYLDGEEIARLKDRDEIHDRIRLHYFIKVLS